MILLCQFVRSMLLLMGAVVMLGLSVGATELKSSLGLPVVVNDFYIPGEKAEPIPRMDRESPLVIRVLEVKSAADGYRYDLEIYGLDPGRYRLSDFLQYKGSQGSLPELSQQITIITEHDLEGIPEPEKLAAVPPDNTGGYRLWLTLGGIIWAVILFLILFWRKKKVDNVVPAENPPTLHEKLSHLVCSAAHGDLDSADRSQLERLILGHWKRKLPEIENVSTTEALIALREHPEASPLLLQLENWLHAPNPSIDQQSITPLLDPFRNA